MSDEAINEIENILLLSRKFAKNKPKYDSTTAIKSLNISPEDIKVALFSKIIIHKYDGYICPNERLPIFDNFRKNIIDKDASAEKFYYIPQLLNNPVMCSVVMNHIIRCTDPKCSYERCAYIKNILKYNFIKTEVNRNS